MKKRTAMVVTRWTNRSLHANYKLMLKNAHLWQNTETELFVALHGDKGVDTYARAAKEAGTIRVLDLRGESPNGYITEFAAAIFAHFLEETEGYDLLALVDDDGRYTKPEYASSKILAAYDEYGYGAFGPMHPFIAWTRYGNQVGEDHKPILGKHWTTYGSQIFSMEFLREARPMWSAILSRCKFRGDVEMFMLADFYGYPMAEMLLAFNHTSSQGSKYVEDPTEWFLTRKAQMSHDYAELKRFVQPLGKTYFTDMALIERGDLSNLKKNALKKGADHAVVHNEVA